MDEVGASHHPVSDTVENTTLSLGNIDIDVEIHSNKDCNIPGWDPINLWLHTLEDAIQATFKYEFSLEELSLLPSCELSIVLSHNDTVRQYNCDYRGKDKATNILSFPGLDDDDLELLLNSRDNDVSQPMPPFMLGDLILAYETLETEALEQKKSLTDHFTHLVTHGLLHLLGYDHINDDDAEIMENRERQILSSLNIRDPYLDNNAEMNRGGH
ncbi:rRNA maturation RNase YbeY [Kordiimonas sp. SCSIO 12610]|uniref:rRNA maturation RNase YbeY n=1 Tax=Kordiimonas sp. SCSIO 12610 TaxID=2829597 RepID=UPI002109F50F|nr:rRNA maturation RNase YbeY [Kordiimonas sp. SCSIO 12610]UTW55092.1 rRNA maturation RNase YbeY [Kordiimonas sp. SCSIO 12610]